MKKNFLLMISIFAFLLILQACGGSDTTDSSNTDTDTEEAGEETNVETDTNYPEGNIEIVVGWGAGGGTDTFARAIAQELSGILDTNINVVNMPGASGANAGDHVTRQPADGYTIWAISSNYPINVATGVTPHDLSKYTAIGRVQQDTMTLQVLSGEKFADLEDFMAQAEANPGQISIGGTGAVGFDELVLRQIEMNTGLELNYISYESAGEMHAALLGGHIDAMLEEIGPAIAHIEGGTIDMLLAFTDQPVEGFEDIPLSVDEGFEVTDGQERGLLVHVDTPPEIVSILESALEEAKDSEDYLNYEQENFLHLREGWLNSADFQSHLEQRIETYKSIVEGLE